MQNPTGHQSHPHSLWTKSTSLKKQCILAKTQEVSHNPSGRGTYMTIWNSEICKLSIFWVYRERKNKTNNNKKPCDLISVNHEIGTKLSQHMESPFPRGNDCTIWNFPFLTSTNRYARRSDKSKQRARPAHLKLLVKWSKLFACVKVIHKSVVFFYKETMEAE